MLFLEARRKGYEAEFVFCNARSFFLQARAYRQAGLWAARKLGKAGQAADDYASGVVNRLARASGDKSALGKLVFDLSSLTDEAHVRRKLEEFLLQPA